MPWEGEDPARARDRFIRQVRAWESQVHGFAMSRFRAQLREMEENLGAGGASSQTEALRALEAAMRNDQEEWMRTYRQIYATVGSDFATEGIPPEERGAPFGDMRDDELARYQQPAAARDVTRPTHLRDAWGDPGDAWWTTEFLEGVGDESWRSKHLQLVLDYVESEGAAKVRGISSATRNIVQRHISHTLDEGGDITSAMDNLRRDWPGLSRTRAERIARTETLTAARSGSHQTVKAAGMAQRTVKSWLNSGQLDRVRDSHIEAEDTQQQVQFEQPFRLVGGEVMFPGDTSRGADPGETINCMCVSQRSVLS